MQKALSLFFWKREFWGGCKIRGNNRFTDEFHTKPLNSIVIHEEATLCNGKGTKKRLNHCFLKHGGAAYLSPSQSLASIFPFTLPNKTEKASCKFVHWENRYKDFVPNNFTVLVNNITLYVVWGCTVIETPLGHVHFSGAVNSDTSSSRTTVVQISDKHFFSRLGIRKRRMRKRKGLIKKKKRKGVF